MRKTELAVKMMNTEEILKLSDMKVGESGKIRELGETRVSKRRLFDLGFIENTIVKCVGKSPLGDVHAYEVRRAVIALRNEDGDNIIITKAL